VISKYEKGGQREISKIGQFSGLSSNGLKKNRKTHDMVRIEPATML